METDDERRAIAEVTDRLHQRYPTVPVSRLKDVVDESYHELDGAPIRSFVGILVEKQARDRLAGVSA